MICGCSDSQCQCDRFGGVGGGRMLMTTIEVQKKITPSRTPEPVIPLSCRSTRSTWPSRYFSITQHLRHAECGHYKVVMLIGPIAQSERLGNSNWPKEEEETRMGDEHFVFMTGRETVNALFAAMQLIEKQLLLIMARSFRLTISCLNKTSLVWPKLHMLRNPSKGEHVCDFRHVTANMCDVLSWFSTEWIGLDMHNYVGP